MQVGGGVHKYPAKAHARRVAQKLRVSHGHILLAATRAASWPNSDMPAPFRQDRYFYYLTGSNEPDCYTTYDIEKDLLTLWLPPIDEDKVVWYGRGSTVEEALEKYDIDKAHYIERNQAFIRSVERKIYREDDQELRQAMDSCRVIKDNFEIELIRQANIISGMAHVDVMRGMHTFENEADVEAAYMKVCIKQRAKVQAYDPIAGSGANAAELHYSANDAEFGSGQTLVLDAGCEVERYASDVTRTLPINHKQPGHWPSKETEQIYNLVATIQESCIKQMVPGKHFIETFWHAHYMVIDGLLKLGILKGDRDEIFHTGTSRAFLPHGLGHHVGLDVHDVSPVPHPPLNFKDDEEEKTQKEHAKIQAEEQSRAAFAKWSPESAEKMRDFDQPFHPSLYECRHSSSHLAPGMVVTIEPGIYFNDFLIKRFFLSQPKHRNFIDEKVLERYMQVGGVRIEDDILITKTGYENLTTAPKGAKMLEIIRESARKATGGH